MLIRVRSNVGVWRVDGLDANSSTVDNILAGIAKSRPHVVYQAPLSSDPPCKQALPANQTLAALGLSHGSMVHCRVDPATCADQSAGAAGPAAAAADGEAAAGGEAAGGEQKHMRRVIGKDGSIQLVPSNEVRAPGEDRGFRKGMLPLRDMKMQWTMADFVALDSQFEFKIKRQETAFCKQVSLDIPSVSDFQAYLQRFQFQRKRFAFLYGKFVKAEKKDDDDDVDMDDDKPNKALVEAIYEPPQEPDAEAAEGWVAHDDPDEDRVDQIAEMLGLRKVGWIFGHEAREPGFVLSSSEVIMAAEFQLEAANGVEDTPFVTIKVAPSKEDGTVSVEAFQVSKQCMAMVAEEALEVDGLDPKSCMVNETFTAIQEGKPSKTVENNFFLTVVPIVQHTSEMFVADFPRCNREIDDRTQSHDEMKRHLQKSGSAGWTFVDRLADFNLLIYLSKFLDLNSDYPKICASIVDKSVPLDDGYKLIIKSMAGMDGAY